MGGPTGISRKGIHTKTLMYTIDSPDTTEGSVPGDLVDDVRQAQPKGAKLQPCVHLTKQ